MNERNIRDFERLIETTVVPECGRVLKSMIRFSRDVQAFRKSCDTAAIARTEPLVEQSMALGGLERLAAEYRRANPFLTPEAAFAKVYSGSEQPRFGSQGTRVEPCRAGRRVWKFGRNFGHGWVSR
jgi:hypothetical protein